jgi:hypothetical protein
MQRKDIRGMIGDEFTAAGGRQVADGASATQLSRNHAAQRNPRSVLTGSGRKHSGSGHRYTISGVHTSCTGLICI